VKKSKSEAIWQRFRGACDTFFARYAQRHDTARAERVAAREAICAELEALAPPLQNADTALALPASESAASDSNEAAPAPQPPHADDAPEHLPATVRALRGRWQQEIAARGVDAERARALDARFTAALNRVMARWPAAFAGTDLDPDANRKRMEALVKRVEDLAASVAGPPAAADANLSPTNRLAAMLKEALAANTIGGKVEDDSRLRAAAEELRQAQAAWTRIGLVAEGARRPLSDRFQRAVRRINEKLTASGAARPAPAGTGPNRGGPGGARGPRQ
jgi:hypothetical protein